MYTRICGGCGTIESMECKVLAVQRFAQPRTRKQVRSFLGLCGYYKKFIPEFSTVASSLSDLTKKNMSKSVKWTSQCEKAFGQLKQALSKATVLITPDWDKPFILQTDASATGLSNVLSQINADGEEHSIVFGSKKLLPREINHSAIEREVLAIVKGIQHFRTHLEGTSFKIETDHNPLTHLSTLKDSHGRLARWALSLQPFDFRIVQRSGKANANADGLSRDTRGLFLRREECQR